MLKQLQQRTDILMCGAGAAAAPENTFLAYQACCVSAERHSVIGYFLCLYMCVFVSVILCRLSGQQRHLGSGISFGNKLFCFLEEEVDWEGSQEELHFLLHYGNFKEYWVGLQREGSRPWKWLNDTTHGFLRCSCCWGLMASLDESTGTKHMEIFPPLSSGR
uniref:Uncharacterized protein n=1 Tax=Malurus cyaneus samueli TaxID=2593467 RepID=A0A8C5TES9_9PASS